MKVRIVGSRSMRNLAEGLRPEQLPDLDRLAIAHRSQSFSVLREGRVVADFPSEALTLRRIPTGEVIAAFSKEGIEPLAEVFNAPPGVLGTLVEAHNRRVARKSPLMIDFARELRPSLLSSRREDPADYGGFVNLLILFSALNYAPIVARHLYHDLRLVPAMAQTLAAQLLRAEALLFIVLVACYFAAVHAVQAWAFRRRRTETAVTAAVVGLSLAYLILGLKLNMAMRLPFLLAGLLNMGVLSGLLKMISYAHVLYNVRWLLQELQKCLDEPARRRLLEECASPSNAQILLENEHCFPRFLSLTALCYYLAAPTFCYQLRYPRSPTVRKLWLAQKVGELIALAVVVSFIVLHWLFPTLREARVVIARHRPLELGMYLLRVSVPYTLAWIVGFIAVFHVWLNVLAEALRFGDREFYRQWWNCRNLAEYWRDWNLPVHSFLLRHLNRPLQNLHLPKLLSNFCVFFASAAAHEYVISLTVGRVNGWVFSAFTLQYVFIVLELTAQRLLPVPPRLGNFLFWFGFCVVAQPALLLLYYLNGAAERI